MTGETILHYEIIEKIGEGGMGVVYKAHDTKLDRIVALKFLPQHLTGDLNEKERFYHEARAAAALTHPNVAVIYEIGEHEGQVFIAMEYVDGKTLKQLVEKEGDSLSIKKVLDISIQVCDGLAAAHEKGIVHRDIKSDNIMLTPKGRVKIMDFGLAKLKGASKLTTEGSTLGTAAYMSPEQARGEDVDRRSDIFSFGVVLYELLTAHLPFRGEHQAALLYSVVNEDPQPIARFNDKVSPELERNVLKALAKDREERYQHIDDLLADLRREGKNIEYARTGSLTSSAGVRPVADQRPREFKERKKRRSLTISASAVLVLALVVLTYLFLLNRPNATITHVGGDKSIAVLPFENLSPDKDNVYFADGIQDLILTKLADVGDLKVISRTSTEKYASHPDNLRRIAEQLGVATILEGSVQKVGDQVLINVQLIDARSDDHIWADSYTRTLNNVFGVEGEVAQEVATTLNAKLTAAQANAVTNIPTRNQEAYDSYLRGEYFYAKAPAGNWAMLPKAVEAYREATRSDPSFALAWAKLGYCQSLLMYASIDRSDSTAQSALANAKHALQLDPGLSFAHFALGYVYRMDFAEYDKALSEFEIAREGLPNNADVLAAIAYIHEEHNQLETASEDLQHAMDLNPNDPNLALGVGMISIYTRRYDRARAAFNRALAIAPDDPEGYASLAENEVIESGDVEAAIGILNRAPESIQSTSNIMYERAELALYKRNYPQAQEYAEALQPGGRFITELDVLLLRAEVARLEGDEKSAGYNYLEALMEANAHSKGRITEKTFRIISGLAIAQAGLGRGAAALKSLNRLVALCEEKGIGLYNQMFAAVNARIDILVKNDNDAIKQIDVALSSPVNGVISANVVRLDPLWDPLRKDPAFQAMLKKYLE
jgi:eukaryotic-like serine/threonine-protein kinase